MKDFFKKHLIPILVFIGITLLVFFPILTRMASKIFGNGSTGTAQDGLQFIWSFWWSKKTCLGSCGDFWNTDFQFFPAGTSLLLHNFSFVNIILILPFMFLGLSPVAAYNITLIGAIALSFFCTYILVYYLTKNRYASLISGLIYGISPFIMGHVIDGQLDLITIQLFPILFLILIKSEKSKRYTYSALSGITLFILTLTSPSYIIFVPFILSFWFIYNIISNPKSYKELLKKAIITSIIFIIPFLGFFYKNIKESSSFSINGPTKWDSEFSSTDLLAFTTPPRINILGGKFFSTKYEDYKGTYSDKSMYLGLSILTLSFLGIWGKRKKLKETFLWTSLGLFGFILALGPKLHVNGKVSNLWMPFASLEKLPVFNMLRAPSRFSLFLFLSLSVLAGYGVMYILQKIKNNRLKIITTIGIMFIVMFEYFPLHNEIRNLEIPTGYKKIKEDQEDFAILEVPILWSTGLENKGIWSPNYIYNQTFHEKKITGGYITRVKNDTYESYKDTPLLNFVMSEQNKKISPNTEAIKTLEKYIKIDPKEVLADNKFKYIIFHKAQMIDLNNKIKNVLKNNLELYYQDEEMEIYTFKN